MPPEMPTSPVRVRIAPSPTGDPHVGTAYIALFNKALAKKTGGQFILRIEDTDRARYVEGSERMIFESLRWLGLDYDEGPDVGGPHGPYRQSERSEIYRRAAAGLIESGHAYPCFCTPDRLAALRKEQEAKKLQPGYDGLCRTIPGMVATQRIAAREPYVVRLAVPREPADAETSFEDGLRGRVTFKNAQVDDQVLVKTDGLPTYHLANVVDDHEMRVTHVIRAEEWISSTPKHVLLYQAFGWDMPKFVHMPLLRNKDKSKISKRKNPTSLHWYRDEGFLPEALVNFLGLMGYSMADEREVFTFAEFVADFDVRRVKATGPVFDLQKLDWLNGEWIRRLGDEEVARRLEAFFPGRFDAARLRQVVPLVRERMKRLKEFPEHAAIFFEPLAEPDAKELAGKLEPAVARAALERALAAFQDVEPFMAAPLEAAARTVAEAAGLKPPDLFMVLRVAATGRKVSPPLFETMAVLGRDEALGRARRAIQKL